MRLIVCLLLVLIGIGWLASEVQLTAAPSQGNDDTGWRRTRDGWQHQSLWTGREPVREPRLHPVLVGVLQLLLSAAALIALPNLNPRHVRSRLKG